MAKDHEFMYQAILEGRKAQNKTGTNPPVGAIIVKDGEIVGRGHTSHLGGPHAEVNALTDAGSKAKDAIVYCTLEPCAHWGRTGPCCEALTNAGVAKVFIGIVDPYPKVSGKGIQHLRDNGVEVVVGGMYEKEIKEDLREFLSRVEEGKQI